MGKLAPLMSSAKGEWNTPHWLYARIIEFLGADMLDPCPDWGAGPQVDAFSYEWSGSVYLNPPYGRAIGKWINKLLHDPVGEAILLLPARVDTRWFQPLFERAAYFCFIRGRLKFGGSEHGAPFPSVLVYIGPRPASFYLAFQDLGQMVRPVRFIWEES